jgi:transcriptional regulator with PAS, ATPase and Fis domain
MPVALTREIVHAPTSPLVPLLENVERIAESQANALVIGESGAGKEAIVRALHELAPWGSGPFVPINCGAIPENLLESELFGHVRGAFTGADRPRKGRFEAANDGTLFLDEIGEMPLALQVKLLRVLQEREFVPLGATTPKKATFRLVAATNRDLDACVEAGSFRQDLLYRLDVVRLKVPSLRDRPMDVPLLADHFLNLYAKTNRSTVAGFTDEAMALMQSYSWPGNVRELENLVQGTLVLKREGVIEREDVARRLRGPEVSDEVPASGGSLELPEDGIQLRQTMERLERDFIRQALRRSEGNKAQAAGLLGMNRTTLVEKLKRHPV